MNLAATVFAFFVSRSRKRRDIQRKMELVRRGHALLRESEEARETAMRLSRAPYADTKEGIRAKKLQMDEASRLLRIAKLKVHQADRISKVCGA